MSIPQFSRRLMRSDRGQVVPLVAVALVVVAAIGFVIVAVGEVLADRATARTAADAAALAAAADGDEAAGRLARANGATVVAIYRDGRQVEVEVRVGRATARARAEATLSSAEGAGPIATHRPDRSRSGFIP